MENPRETMHDALNAFLADRPNKPVTPGTAEARPASPAAHAAAPASGQRGPGGKEELVAAFDRLVEHEATKPRRFRLPVPVWWRRFAQPAIITASVLAMAYFWIAKPAWLYPPVVPIAAPTNAHQAQQTLIAASILIEQFRQTHNRLPSSLAEAGADIPSVSILADSNGGFRLIGGVASQPMSYRNIPGGIPILEGVSR